MVIKNSLDTYTLDQTIGNGVHGEGTTQIEHTSTEAGATLTVVVNNCAYETSKVTGASVPDSLTESGHINETLTTNADCSLPSDSDGIGAGVKWWGNSPRSHGVNGEPYPDSQIDIGAYQSTYDENHPANLGGAAVVIFLTDFSEAINSFLIGAV
ncbi:MAG: hypothetical protein GY938_13395 [Ketobacter sp.]|nr:hypothetical protein [Ketobacter sp.]